MVRLVKYKTPIEDFFLKLFSTTVYSDKYINPETTLVQANPNMLEIDLTDASVEYFVEVDDNGDFYFSNGEEEFSGCVKDYITDINYSVADFKVLLTLKFIIGLTALKLIAVANLEVLGSVPIEKINELSKDKPARTSDFPELSKYMATDVLIPISGIYKDYSMAFSMVEKFKLPAKEGLYLDALTGRFLLRYAEGTVGKAENISKPPTEKYENPAAWIAYGSYFEITLHEGVYYSPDGEFQSTELEEVKNYVKLSKI